MRTRREQMQAYRFVIRRIVAAVLSGQPEALDRPMRRLGISLFVSAMLGVLAFAGFGIYGLLTNPASDPDAAGELIVVRGTGTVYLFVDGLLHPVPNLASGRLILGSPADARQVSQSSLVDIPRGRTLGIPNAPPDLPGSGDLLGLPWRVCSVPATPGQATPTTTVVIDRGLAGASTPVGDRALYVTAGEQHYLLWNDTRLLIPDPDVAALALGLPSRPIAVGEPLINTVSAGPDLAPPPVEDAGQDSGLELGGEPAPLGDLIDVGDQHYLLTADGLGAVGDVAVTLLAAAGVEPRPIQPSEAGGLDRFDLEPDGFPSAMPALQPAAGGRPTVCTAYQGESAGQLGTTIEVFDSAPEELSAGAGAIPLRQTVRDPVRVADQAVIAGGRGALVQAVPHAGETVTPGTVYLITDQGIKYPLADRSVGALGYDRAESVPVPEDLLAMVPTGPTLSQGQAILPIGGEDEGAG